MMKIIMIMIVNLYSALRKNKHVYSSSRTVRQTERQSTSKYTIRQYTKIRLYCATGHTTTTTATTKKKLVRLQLSPLSFCNEMPCL